MFVNSMSKGFVQLSRATAVGKKWKMTFYDKMRKKIKSVQFGQVGYEDFTTHGDLQRKQNYIQRHKSSENWNDPYSAGALSYHLLWSKPSLSGAYTAYRKRFIFELY
jgi:hypothetical protein